MFYFYLLKSEKTGRFYKGHCEDLQKRIKQHNSGKTSSIRSGIPWKAVYTESFSSRGEAAAKEKYYKTLKGSKELALKLKAVGSPARAGTNPGS